MMKIINKSGQNALNPESLSHQRMFGTPSHDLVSLPPLTMSSACRSKIQGSRPFAERSRRQIPSVISSAAKWGCSSLGTNKMDGATSSWLYGGAAEAMHCILVWQQDPPPPCPPWIAIRAHDLTGRKTPLHLSLVNFYWRTWHDSQVINCVFQSMFIWIQSLYHSGRGLNRKLILYCTI